MNPERWKRVCEIFEGARAAPEAERSDWVARQCGPDLALRNEVEALLEVDGSDPRTLGELTRDRTPLASAGAAGDGSADEPDESIGRVIGDYRLLERIGDGGMGRVYLAERADGEFDTRVAIKLLRRGMDTDDILARFRRERQVLADLKHVNIARLIDGGSTEEGLPYLVMEHIDGVPLDRYCSMRDCGVEERLRLFRRVCDAVAYAHTNLVIHRDLKPGNILVDRDGVPKLLDFGIAKVLQCEADDATIDVTAPLLRRLTPGYASPEQVRGERMTTATDVYSLGVVLFELLTGVRPGRTTRGIPDPRASTTITDNTPEARRLRKRLSGDLDTILQMAMREEPERRYASVRELAEDIDRHLGGLPVHARPDSLSYRTTKFVRRHRVSLTLAMAGTLFLIASVATIINFWIDADRSAAIARSAEGAAGLREYIARISAADVAIHAGNLAAARDQLDATERAHRGWEYWHLRHELRSTGRTLVGRTDRPIHHLEFTPDGSSMVSVSNEVIVWDSATDAVRARYRGSEAALGAAHHPTRPLLVIAHADGRVLAYDYKAEQKTWIGKPCRDDEPRNAPLNVVFGNDGSLVAVEDQRGTVRVWSCDALQDEPRVHEEITVGSPSLRFLPGTESPRFLARTAEGLCAFDARTGEILSVVAPLLTGHFTTDASGETLWADVGNGELCRVDLAGDTPNVHATITRGMIGGMAFDRTGERLAVATTDGTVLLCDANDLQIQSRLEDDSLSFQSVAISPRDSTLAVASSSRSIRVWSLDQALRNGSRTYESRGSAAFPEASSVVFIEGGAEGFRPVRLDLRSGTRTEPFALDSTIDHTRMWARAWAPDGSSAVCASYPLAPVLVHCRGTSTPLAIEKVKNAAYSPDGDWVLIVDERDRLQCFSTDSRDPNEGGRLPARPDTLAADIEAACSIWIDSDHLLVGDRHGRLHRVQRSTSRVTSEWPVLDAEIVSISATPDRSRIALGSSDGSAVVLDAAGATVIHRTARHDSSISSVALTSMGDRLAIGSADGILRLVDPASGEVTFTRALGQPIWSLAFSLDDRALAVCLEPAELHVLLSGTPIEHRIHELFEDLIIPSDVRHRIDVMAELTETERADARRAVAATIHRLDPADLNEQAWRVASLPGATFAEYELARRKATAAVELDPDNGYLLNTLGATLYRCGEIDEAIDVLERSRTLNLGRLPADDALLCMAYAARGDLRTAQAALERLEAVDVAGGWGWSMIKLQTEAKARVDDAAAR